MNICFDNEGIVDYEKLSKILISKSDYEIALDEIFHDKHLTFDIVNKLSLRDRFDVASGKIYDVISTNGNLDDDFIMELNIACKLIHFSMPNTPLQNATTIYISYSHRLPFFNFRRLQTIEVIVVYKKSDQTEIHATSFYYHPKRLFSPYIDDCIRYRN